MGHPAFSLLIPFGVAAAVTAAACPPIERASRRLGIIDNPNERSSHELPTPRSGGLACAAGVLAGCLVEGSRSRRGLAARVMTFALSGIGLADDKVGLPPGPRFAAQMIAGAAYGAEVGGPTGALLGSVVLPATVNATNFMDGINGMTAGTVLMWSANHRIQLPDSPAYGFSGASPAPIAGAALGFLPFNAPNARLFLGDSGSYLFGAAIATTLISDLTDECSPRTLSIGAAHAPMLVYFADTGITIVRRAIRGASLTQAHREHFYQRLQSSGPYPHWAVSLTYFALQLIVAGSAHLMISPRE